MTQPFAFDPTIPYRELREPVLPPALRELALACFAAQRRAAESSGTSAQAARGTGNDAVADEPDAVSPDALERLLASGRRVGGIVTERDAATAIPFNARLARDVVRSREVAVHRRRLDAALARWAGTLFATARPPVLLGAGQWWYPPGTWFGWHTNEAYPGWRLYLSHAEVPGRSFFRYRDPASRAVTTSSDAGWDLRFFEVSAERPFWHAIASDTHRFSVGWHVRPWSLRDAAAARVKHLFGR